MHKVSHKNFKNIMASLKVQKRFKKTMVTAAAVLSVSGVATGSLVGAVQAQDTTPQTEQTSKTPNGLRVTTNFSPLEKNIKDAKALGIKVDELEPKETLVKPGESAAKVVEYNAAMQKQAVSNAKTISDYKAKKDAFDADHKTWTEQKKSHDAAVKQYETNRTIYEKARVTYNTAKEKYDKDYATYKTQKAAWDKAKAKYDQDSVDYRVAKAEYDKAMAKYKADLEAYNKAKAANEAAKKAYDAAMVVYNKQKQAYDAAVAKANADGIKVDGVNSADIKQQLVMGREPQADVNVKLLSSDATLWGKVGRNQVDPNTSDSFWKKDSQNRITPEHTPGSDSKYAVNIKAKTPQGVTGQFVESTHSNLQHTFYGNTKVSKIVATYSNLGADPHDSETETPYLTINSDPTDSFWYFRSSTVGMSLKLYDNKGQQIKMNQGTAYLAITSLNAEYSADGVSRPLTKTGKPRKVESAELLSAGKAMKLGESSVGAYDKKLVSPTTNATTVQALNDGVVNKYWDGWDSQTSGKNIYGAGLFEIDSNPVMQFSSNGGVSGYDTWATYTTIIPKSTLPTPPSLPAKPTYTPLGEAPKAPTNEPVAPKPIGEAPKEPVAPTPPIAPKTPDELREEPKAPAIPTIKVQRLEVYEQIEAKKEVLGDSSGIVVDKKDDKSATQSETENKEAQTETTTKTDNDKDTSSKSDIDQQNASQDKAEQTTLDANKDKKQIDLNDKTVVAGKMLDYQLRTSALPAGRDKLSSYEIVDKIPDGLKVDKDKFSGETDKTKWDVSVVDGYAHYKATKALLDAMNKDVTKSYQIDSVPHLTGMATKTDSTIENLFDVKVQPEGKDTVTTTSNKVTNKTPKALKGSIAKTINGKQTDQVKPGDSYKYELEAVLGNVDAKDKPIADNIVSDQLESVVQFDKVESVTAKNTEVVKAFTGGKVDKNNKFTITGKDTAKFAGDKVKIVLDVHLKKDADYSKYTTNRLIQVPNTAKLLGTPIDGSGNPSEMATSNTVKTFYSEPRAPKKAKPLATTGVANKIWLAVMSALIGLTALFALAVSILKNRNNGK